MSAAGLGRVIEAIARARAPKEPPTPAGPPLEGEPRLERPPCPLCGATRAELERTGGDTWVADAASSRLRFSVARCAVCTLRYTTPRFRPEYRHLAFSGSYPFYLRARRALAGEGGGPVESELAAFHSRAEGLARQHPRPGRLLDVGGGDGVFSVVMGRRGWDVRSVDVEPDVVRYATEVLGLSCSVADVERDPLPEGPFDAISLWGMLQLAYDPRAVLERLRPLLAPDGVLAIGVSNYGGLGSRLFGASWRGLGLPRHLVHFTPESLSRLLDWTGYTLCALEFETPRWVVAGSIDDRLGVPGPARRLVRWGGVQASRAWAEGPLGDTMMAFATPRPPTPAGS